MLLATFAAALAATAIWLTFDNPAIDGTSRGDSYTCLASWDTALNDADNYPGGEPPPDGDDIAARCRDAGHARFAGAVASACTASALAVFATVSAWRRRREGVHPSPNQTRVLDRDGPREDHAQR
jgi:hypothetical protein